MKYTLLFAATAAAYDAYGGYGAQQSSSVPAKASSSAPSYGGYGDKPVTSVKTSTPAAKATPCTTSVGKDGYTTVVPGYGKTPVTVTTQHQAYPTCVAKGYDGKSCDKWEDDKYVSTTVTDYNKKVVTITKVQDYVTVYHEKKTITRYATPTAGGYGAVSTPVVGNKNNTGVWYELYELVKLCEYQNVGKNLLVGWTGPGLCQKCDTEQPIVVKEYKDGKWSETKKTVNYGKPKDEVKTYEKPGVYTVPGKVVTVDYPVTSVVTVTKTITVNGKPTTTAYTSNKVYEAGVYRYDAKVITITKANQPYTCEYEQPKQTPSKTPSRGQDYPSQVTKTPTYNNGNGYDKPSATPTPKYPSNDYPSYPSYPNKSNSTSSSKPVYDDSYGAKSTPIVSSASKPYYPAEYPTATPVYGDNYKPSSSAPSKPSSTPCDDDKKKATPTPNKPVYDDSYKAPTPTPNKPVYDNGNNNGGYGDSKPTPTPPTPSKPVYDNNNGYGAAKPTPTPGYNGPAYAKRDSMVERRNKLVL